jgi:hypothetical protein
LGNRPVRFSDFERHGASSRRRSLFSNRPYLLNSLKRKTMLRDFIERLRLIRDGEDIEKDAGSYWSLSGREERIQDQSHWCGAMRWNSDRWYRHGDFHMDLILNYLQRFEGADYIRSLPNRTALDWGCGGGAVVRPLCGRFSRVYGVEVSESSLAECAKQMSRFGLSNFQGVFIPSHDPESALDRINRESVDFLISVNVFQHFPSKTYAGRVLRVMGQLAKPGAFALLQVRYFDGSEKLRQKAEDYARNVIYMTSFTPEEFSPLLQEAGFLPIGRDRDVEGGSDCHDYYFVRKR